MKEEKNKESTGLTTKDKTMAIAGGLFFLVLFCIAMFGGGGKRPININPVTSGDVITSNQDGNSGSNNETEIDKLFSGIKANNYNFTYTYYSFDNSIEIIDGMVYNNKKKFTIYSNDGHGEYGQISDSYLKFENGSYIPVNDNIRDYFKYLNIDDIISLIDISMYDDSNEDYGFAVSIVDLIDLYGMGSNSVGNYVDDSIVLYVANDTIRSITIDYSNYLTYLNGYNTKFKVKMEFSNYGGVTDFNF